MANSFTLKEKQNWQLKKFIRDHLFEFALDIGITVLLTWLLLKICKAEYILPGLILSFFYALARVIYQIVRYKKDYINLQIK